MPILLKYWDTYGKKNYSLLAHTPEKHPKKKSQYIVPLGTKLTFTYLSLRWAPAVCYTNGPLISDTLLPHKGRQRGKPALFFHWNSQEKMLFLTSFSAEVMLIL